ncbi:MAG TPA: hypothetical protein VHM70_18260 [Polyangiaceae bacterium]|nr:hypothetical protein [Polyangiaceae bacterium]
MAITLALLSAACDVLTVVGYNDVGSNGKRCGPAAPLLACDQAACVVQEMGPARVGSTAVGVDDDFAYFFRSATDLSRMPIEGGDSVDLATTNEYSMQMAVDEHHVYWTLSSNEVWRVPKAGGAAERVLEVFGHPTTIALDDTHVYVALTDSNQLVMAPKKPGKATLLSGQTAPLGLATDADYVYWVNQGSGGDGQIMRAPLGDLADPEVLASQLNAPALLTLGAAQIYFTAGTELFELDKQGGKPRAVLDGLGETKGLVAFSDSVYISGMNGLQRFRDGKATLLEARPVLALAAGCSGVVATIWFESGLIRFSP